MSLIKFSIEGGSSVLQSRLSRSMILSVVRPIETAAWSECCVISYSLTDSHRDTGSEMAIMNSSASLKRGENLSRKQC